VVPPAGEQGQLLGEHLALSVNKVNKVNKGVVPPAGEQGQLLGELHALSVNDVRLLGNLSIIALNLIPWGNSFKLRLQTGC